MPISAIITGATGMVGEGVLLACLASDDVERVLVLNRRPGGRAHVKLREIIHADFADLGPVAADLAGYDACFFCAGMSSVGVAADEYRRVTYDLTLSVARTLAAHDPRITFCYLSGMGTDSTENGRSRWARVKGATENALMRLLPNAYAFRGGFMRATQGQRNLALSYKLLAWVYPIGRRLYPAGFCMLEEVGRAMIAVATRGSPKHVLEVKDIVALANS